jgi:hypothetical protein
MIASMVVVAQAKERHRLPPILQRESTVKAECHVLRFILVSLASFACPFSCERRSRSRAQTAFRDDVSMLHPIPPTESMFFWLSSLTTLLLLVVVVLRRRECQLLRNSKRVSHMASLPAHSFLLSRFPAPFLSLVRPSWSTSYLMPFVPPRSPLSLENRVIIWA